MGKYIKLFKTHSQYERFTATTEFVLPNVSYCENVEDEVHYNPVPPEGTIVAHYYVNDEPNTAKANGTQVKLYEYYAQQGDEENWIRGVDLFNSITINGEDVDVASVDSNNGYWSLNNGDNVVVYDFKDPTFVKTFLFNECGMLTSVEIAEGLRYIYEGAFYDCYSLSSATLPETLEEIGGYAFYECSQLSSINIPTEVDTIGNYAFCDCNNLPSSVINEINAINPSARSCGDTMK